MAAGSLVSQSCAQIVKVTATKQPLSSFLSLLKAKTKSWENSLNYHRLFWYSRPLVPSPIRRETNGNVNVEWKRLLSKVFTVSINIPDWNCHKPFTAPLPHLSGFLECWFFLSNPVRYSTYHVFKEVHSGLKKKKKCRNLECMELYIEDLTLFIVNRGHKTLGNTS